MNFFNRFDNTDKSVVNFKPDVKKLDPQPQNVVRTVSSQPAPQQALATQPINTVKEKTMTSYVDLQKQIKALQEQAETARKEELSGIINQIKAQVAEFHLSVSDIFPNVKVKAGKSAAAKVSHPVMYRTPEGDEWIGPGFKGKKPGWVSRIIESHGDDYLKYLEKFRVA